jgi:competence protein ComEC
MIGVVMVAVLLDRTAISLHTVGWAALVLMAIYPDAVVGASFEMSFMAVLALVAVAEHVTLRARWRTPEGQFMILPAVGVILAAAVVTDIAAGGSTAIFAIYHFNRFPTYSMVSNLIADPIIGLWVMPWGLLAGLTMPFGLEVIPLRLAGYGVGAVNAVARTVATWPHAQVHVPPMSAAALVVAACGLLFLCLWRGRLRLAGLAVIAAGLAQPWFATPPDIVVDEDSKVVAISDDHGHLVLRPGWGERFIREVWIERYGASENAWPEPGNETLNLRCDSDGCILHRKGQRVLIAYSATALAEDCEDVDAAVSLKAAHAFCPETEVVDRIDLRRRGAVAMWLTPDGVRTRFVADGMGERRWVATTRTPRLTDQRDRNTAPAASEISTGEASPPDDPAP